MTSVKSSSLSKNSDIIQTEDSILSSTLSNDVQQMNEENSSSRNVFQNGYGSKFVEDTNLRPKVCSFFNFVCLCVDA